MYTLLELESKTFGELKKIGHELNVLPAGDRRRRQSCIDALVNVKPPLLALLEASPAALVDRPQKAIAPATKTQKRVQNPIEEVQALASFKIGDLVKSLTKRRGIKNKSLTGSVVLIHPSGGVRVTFFGGGTLDYSRSQLKDLIVQEPQITKVVNILKSTSPEILSDIAWHFFMQSPDWFKEVFCSRIWDESKDIDFVVEIIRSFCVNRLRGCNFDNIFEIFQRVLVGQEEIHAQELARKEKLQARKLIRETVENPPGAEVQHQESLESKFGRIAYPQPAQEPIAQAAKNTHGVEVDRVQDIINETWTSWEKEYCAWLKDAKWCIHHGKNKRIDAFLPVSKTLRLEGMRPGVEYCPIYEVSECTYDIDGSPLPVCSSLYTQEAITRAETSPGVEAEHVQDLPIESMFGRIAYPPLAQDLIAQNEEARPHLDRIEGANVHNLGFHPAKSDRDSSGAKTEALGSQEGDRVLAVARDCETGQGRVLPDRSIKLVNQAQEPIAPVPETSPGVDLIDDELPECSNCFGDGYTEDEFGSIEYCKFCQCKTEPRLSRQKTQRAILPMQETSPGVEVSFSDRQRYWADRGFFLIPEAPAVPEKNPAVESEGCIYCTSPEYKSWRDETYRCYVCEPEPDLNPILTGIPLSDRFLARYAPPQSETLHYELTDGYRADTDGQLSLFAVQVVSEPKPPDPDDFESLDAFREDLALWEAQNPKPLDASLDSMCEWAPCPHEWYEPEAENLPSKASSTVELLEQFQVMELLRGSESYSDNSEFFIPTFGSLGDRFKGRDEPPDTGIFARLPKPKPPTFPPQASQPKSAQVRSSQAKSAQAKASHLSPKTASWTQVEHKLNTSWTQVNQASRKLFHCVVAGTNNQPARSPPGGDAIS
jgi:hypothetical protein